MAKIREPHILTGQWAQGPECQSTRPVADWPLWGRSLFRNDVIVNNAGSPAPLPEIPISLVCGGAPGSVSLKFPQAILLYSQARETLISGPIAYLVLELHLQYP